MKAKVYEKIQALGEAINEHAHCKDNIEDDEGNKDVPGRPPDSYLMLSMAEFVILSYKQQSKRNIGVSILMMSLRYNLLMTKM